MTDEAAQFVSRLRLNLELYAERILSKESGIIIYNHMKFVSVFYKNGLLHYFVSVSTPNYLGFVSNDRRYREQKKK